MTIVLESLFGSHLYGTSTKKSDYDYKKIILPEVYDILLGKTRGSVQTKREKSEGEKNYAGEVEVETFTLYRYLQLLAEGQTVALDILFTPVDKQITHSSIWDEIFANRHKLVSKKVEAFVGYCCQQANKYGIKGSRVAAARSALNTLNEAVYEYGSYLHDKLATVKDRIEWLVGKTEHMAIVPIEQVSGQPILHWEVCGRKFSYTASIGNARDILDKLVKEYGSRALQAESQQGVDWKALSHAVRVANEAVELFTTGEIVFPLKNRQHILDIKLGKLTYQEVGKEIEDLFVQVEETSAKSSLRDEPDHQWINNFVYEIYLEHVGREYQNKLDLEHDWKYGIG